MASGKEIRTQISSIKSTQKITSAMEMVAASKMRKTQERMSASRPYTEKMIDVIVHLAHASSECKHSYLHKRESKRVGYIVISSDRGLCGGLNSNLFKETIANMQQWHQQDIDIDLCVIGKKATAFFKRVGGNVVSQTSEMGDVPSLEKLIGSVKVMLDAYDEGRIDRLYIVFNKFINTMSQQPIIGQLLPISIPDKAEEVKRTRYYESGGDDSHHLVHQWDYLYEPDAEEVMNALFLRYIEAVVYQAVVENLACEMGARMVAMKSATDNASDLMDELELVYNKARQASITQELSEIVAGAAAV